jgi:hypothetical protein
MFTKVKKKECLSKYQPFSTRKRKLISEISFVHNYLTLLTLVISKDWSRTMYEVQRCKTRTTYDAVALSNTYQSKEETADIYIRVKLKMETEVQAI